MTQCQVAITFVMRLWGMLSAFGLSDQIVRLHGQVLARLEECRQVCLEGAKGR